MKQGSVWRWQGTSWQRRKPEACTDRPAHRAALWTPARSSRRGAAACLFLSDSLLPHSFHVCINVLMRHVAAHPSHISSLLTCIFQEQESNWRRSSFLGDTLFVARFVKLRWLASPPSDCPYCMSRAHMVPNKAASGYLFRRTWLGRLSSESGLRLWQTPRHVYRVM